MGTLEEGTVLDSMKGAFVESLKRNNKKIREDRAITIAEDTMLKYKRKVEDLRMEIKGFKRSRDLMLDLSPDTGDSLKLAINYDADTFVNDDIDLGVKIRQIEIKLEIAVAQYEKLFGEKI